MLGKKSICVLHLNVFVFKWKPKRQKYSEVKTELEFPSPIHFINEIIPQQCLLPCTPLWNECTQTASADWIQCTENLSCTGF